MNGGCEVVGVVQTLISKETSFCGQTEPASGRIASAFCVRSSRISCAFLAFISCVWCTRTPHFPSTASDVLVAALPTPGDSPLYPPPYPLVYWPPAYSLRLRASGHHLCYAHTSGDLDLSASISFRPLQSYVAVFLVCTLLSFP